MKKAEVFAILSLVLVIFLFCACESLRSNLRATSTLQSHSGSLVDTPLVVPTTVPTSTPIPLPWPLQIQIGQPVAMPTCERMLTLQPRKSSLQDVYDLLGQPLERKDFPTGVVLGYPCERMKFRNVVLLDGTSGDVLLIGAFLWDESCPRLEDLETEYGEYVIAAQNGRRQHWFFEGSDVAYLGNILQILPPGTTLDEYQAANGYFDETFAFTP